MKAAAKLTLMTFVFALACWAQTATQTPGASGEAQKAATPQSETKAGCPCCQKMADSKNAMPCCAHHKHESGEDAAMCCCNGKDDKSCMKGDNSAGSRCPGGNGSNGKGKKGCCCSDCEQGDKMAMGCCGHGHCGMSHDHASMDHMDK
jgi:hypothetical protein